MLGAVAQFERDIMKLRLAGGSEGAIKAEQSNIQSPRFILAFGFIVFDTRSVISVLTHFPLQL
ncbi:hypothetical protein PJE062_2421 [Pseudovibrio sp. JE062]|nr:hypothetical protein PJE062_2421 [Pseudovibrio sp. JE062]